MAEKRRHREEKALNQGHTTPLCHMPDGQSTGKGCVSKLQVQEGGGREEFLLWAFGLPPDPFCMPAVARVADGGQSWECCGAVGPENTGGGGWAAGVGAFSLQRGEHVEVVGEG